MGLPARKQDIFTYGDYLSWDDSERWEIINGQAYNMAAAPLTVHQLISSELMRQLGNQLLDKPCNVIAAPFDVRLPMGDEKEEEIINVVQPDISLVCDPGKLDEKGCLGPPDLIIEILSNATSRKDRFEKFNLYESAGVKEYWLVSPDDKIVEIFRSGEDGRFTRPEIYCETDTARVKIKPADHVTVDLGSVFNVIAGSEEPK